MDKKSNMYGVWSDFFSEGYIAGDYTLLKADAKLQSEIFLAGTQLDNENTVLDKWIASSEAQKMLSALVVDMQRHIHSVSEFALPAHDIRQILFKDAAEGLRFYQLEKPAGYKSAFMIPMEGHDLGRLLEGRFYHPENPHDNWIPHSQLSYLMFNAILDKPDYTDMPKALKNHFLYAIVAHSGDNGKTYMSRAVQTCDRMQLIGAEGFFRALSYVVCLMGEQIQYPICSKYKNNLPDMPSHTSVLSLLEYFSRNMRENIGGEHLKWQQQVAVENVAILIMACHDNEALKNKIFAPELDPSGSYGAFKQRLPDDIMEAANRLYSLHSSIYQTLSSQFDMTHKIFHSLQSPIGSAQLTNNMKIYMDRAIGFLMENERYSLYQALCFAKTLRTEQDECDRTVISSIGEQNPKFIQLIAEEATLYCPQLHGQGFAQIAHNSRLAPI